MEAVFEEYRQLDLTQFKPLERKLLGMLEPGCNIQAPPLCGKSHLLIALYNRHPPKESLFLDLEDRRIDKEGFARILPQFLQEHSIRHLFVDNLKEGFKLPDVPTLYSTSDTPLTNRENRVLGGLDFEEFMMYERRFSTPKNSFNNLLKLGNLPLMHARNHPLPGAIQGMLQRSLGEEFGVFAFLHNFIGAKSSIYHLFTLYKQQHKISKDRFYRIFNSLLQKRCIHTIKRPGQEASSALLMSCNFIYPTLLCAKKDFLATLKNMVFLEIKEQEVYYGRYLDFFLKEERKGIIISPFPTRDALMRRIESMELPAAAIDVISVGNEDSFFHNGVAVEVMPFWEFATR